MNEKFDAEKMVQRNVVRLNCAINHLDTIVKLSEMSICEDPEIENYLEVVNSFLAYSINNKL